MRLIRHILCVACLAVGVIGLILPIIPGIPFLIIGIGLLEERNWIRRRVTAWIHRWKARKES